MRAAIAPREAVSERRAILARAGLAPIPKMLTLQDRNPHSPTYGCFDRNYWHYRVIDFPSGMAQELVWPLALAFTTNIPGNPYYGSPAMREWVVAGVRFAGKSARRDGSCDDYYPFERALGAAAFSLLACVEAIDLLDILDAENRTFLVRRADWLATHRESGTLSNHSALTALALLRTSELLGEERWRSAIDGRIETVLSLQNAEGWFQEYEGCDPGYLTLTIGALAELDHRAPRPGLKEAIVRAVRFASEVVLPDGSFGGELGSRNTHLFFPHGLERTGLWLPEALELNDRAFALLASGRTACFDDDRLLGHLSWSRLVAWRNYVERRPVLRTRKPGRTIFPEAGLLIDRRGDTELFVALNKGGVFKLFRGGAMVASDTQLSAILEHRSLISRGRRENAVAHLIDRYPTRIEIDELVVEGSFGVAKASRMTTAKLILLRALMFSIGRFAPNLARSLLQRMLIVGKKRAPLAFERRFAFRDGRWCITDSLSAENWREVKHLGIGGHQSSIYVAASRTFLPEQLVPWLDLDAELERAQAGTVLRIEREL